MTIANAIFQGITQGLTEFLPVSSSGHLSLIQYFTGQSGESSAYFSILLHMGTLLSVCLAFSKTLIELIQEVLSMFVDIFTGKFSMRQASPKRRMIILLIVSLFPMIITVFLKDWFSSLSSDNSILAEGLCFLLTSFLLFLSVKSISGHKNASTMKYKDALAIGLTQSIAPLPGLSRSGSTISVGVLMGLERKFAVEFSFIMGIPAVIGANILEIKNAEILGSNIPTIVVVAGLLSSFIFGIIAIKMVNWLITSDKFKYFAWYTFALGICVVIIAIIEIVTNHAIQNWTISLLN